ncbi:hypothetical protein [Cryobacterium roopkundense]|uniref:Uncharacterized protein n=1 Tax=Cryobacterium roopkundense TaxID=1001240 RepID=A0A7W8ZSR5_9MICO|nr:hypothetical protein [Cryobacterium roopkundense]MBB5639507.1 hypothetical protein [Cryobacterium roopkundense]
MLGLMVLGLIFASLITASVVGAYGVTSATRSGVQSGAAADAGIAAVRASLYQIEGCKSPEDTGAYSAAGSQTSPKYDAQVWFTLGELSAVGNEWFEGCPLALATYVKIVSTGYAQQTGVNGAAVGDQTTIEAVLKYGNDAAGVALYLYKGGTVEANSEFIMTGSPGAGIMVKDGDFTCAKNNSEIIGNVVVTGNLTLASTGQACSIKGDVWVSQLATLGQGKVEGNLSSGAVSPTLTSGMVGPNPPGTTVGGTYTQPAVMPAVPPWTEIGPLFTRWKNKNGTPYEVKTQCNLTDRTPGGSTSLGGTAVGMPVIINALGCVSGPTVSSNTTVRLTSDVVIYANTFDFSAVNQLNFSSSSTASHRIWFITPDLNPSDLRPSCNRALQGDFAVKVGFTIADRIEALLYTPCAFISTNNFSWRGQIIAGEPSAVKNNPVFAFAPVGIPGVNLTTGSATSVLPIPQPGSVVSNREVSY